MGDYLILFPEMFRKVGSLPENHIKKGDMVSFLSSRIIFKKIQLIYTIANEASYKILNFQQNNSTLTN
jgi:hypothetical protein